MELDTQARLSYTPFRKKNEFFLVQDKKSDRMNRMNKIILFFIMVNPKFTISKITQPSFVYCFNTYMDLLHHVDLKANFFVTVHGGTDENHR